MNFIVRDFTPEDAAAVARMYNESDAGWPSGLTGGQPYTAERVLESEGKRQFVSLLLAVADDRVVGYCSVVATPGQSENVYVGLLNCVPDWHGRGVGKALLLEAVKRATAAGYRCLDLHTWAGNKKAVPLYKKTGFFWQPDTSVHMENYLPQILPHPLMREFLNGRDWYSLYRRELKLVEDKIEWNGIKAYIYEFESEKGSIRFIIDRESNGITGIETSDFYAACMVGKEDFAAGIKTPIRWVIRNKKANTPMSVSLLAEGETGIPLHVQETFDVQDEITLEKSFRADTGAVKRWDANRAAHIINTTLVINGKMITLQSGVVLKDPIVAPQFRRLPVLRPGVTTPAEVYLRSYVESDVDCEVQFGPVAGMKVEPVEDSGRASIPAMGWSGGRYTLTPEKSGGFEIPVRIRFKQGDQTIESRPAPIPVVTLAPGGVEGFLTETSAVLCNEHVRVVVARKGGWVGLHSPDDKIYYGGFNKGLLGVPFDYWEFGRTYFDLKLEKKEGEVSLIFSASSTRFPGVILEGQITLTAGPVLKANYRLLNESGDAKQIQLKVEGYLSSDSSEGRLFDWVSIPLKEGIVHERIWQNPLFPSQEDLPKEPEAYSESWICYEGKDLTIGSVWSDAEMIRLSAMMPLGLVYPAVEIPAGGWVDLPPFLLYAGSGNWKKVRELWASHSGKKFPEKVTTLPMIELKPESGIMLVSEEESKTELKAISYRGRDTSGTLEIELPKDFSTDVSNIRLESLKRGNPGSLTAAVRTKDLSPRVSCGKIRLVGDSHDLEAVLPILVTGNSSLGIRTEESGDGDYTIDNGWMTLRFSAKHRGSLYAIERNGQNHLATSYPNPTEFIWFNPWYGGVYVIPQGPWGMMDFAKFHGESIQRTGVYGLNWHGVRFISEPENKHYRWMKIETDFLTLPGSNLIAVIGRIINKTGAYARSGFEVMGFADPEGTRKESVDWYYEADKLQSVRRDEFGDRHPCADWAAISTPNHKTCLSIIRGPQIDVVGVSDFGREASTLGAGCDFSIDPFQSKEAVAFLALTDDVDSATAYRFLSRLKQLP